MKRNVLLFVLACCCGCGGSGTAGTPAAGAADVLTAAQLAALKPGMTPDDVSQRLTGTQTIVMATGATQVVQWKTGDGNETRSIVVTFQNGKLATTAGTNLQ